MPNIDWVGGGGGGGESASVKSQKCVLECVSQRNLSMIVGSNDHCPSILQGLQLSAACIDFLLYK